MHTVHVCHLLDLAGYRILLTHGVQTKSHGSIDAACQAYFNGMGPFIF
jgi:hypothetical protein